MRNALQRPLDLHTNKSLHSYGSGRGGGALQSVSDTRPDFDLRLLQNVIYNINNIYVINNIL